MISQPFYANSTSIIFVVVDQKKQNTQRTEPFLGLGDGGWWSGGQSLFQNLFWRIELRKKGRCVLKKYSKVTKA